MKEKKKQQFYRHHVKKQINFSKFQINDKKVAKLAAKSAPLSSNSTSEERWRHLINSLEL